MNRNFQTAALLIVGLMMLGATAVQSATLGASHAIVAGPSPLVSYAQDVAQAMRRTETGVLPLEDR